MAADPLNGNLGMAGLKEAGWHPLSYGTPSKFEGVINLFALKELLAVFKMSPGLVGSMEMQIVDNWGRTVDL